MDPGWSPMVLPARSDGLLIPEVSSVMIAERVAWVIAATAVTGRDWFAMVMAAAAKSTTP